MSNGCCMENKLLDAAVRLYHKREREQFEMAMEFWINRTPFKNNNHGEIWTWGAKRWKRVWSDREYELREKHWGDNK